MATYNQPTSAPTAKVKAVGVAGVVTVLVPLVVTILASFGVIVPQEVSDQAIAGIGAIVTIWAAIQSIVHFAAGYFKKSETK